MKKYLFILLIIMLQCCNTALPVYAFSTAPLEYDLTQELLASVNTEIKTINNKQTRSIINNHDLRVETRFYVNKNLFHIFILVDGDIETHKLIKLTNVISEKIYNTIRKSKINKIKTFSVITFPIIVTKKNYLKSNVYYRKFTAYDGPVAVLKGKEKKITIWPAKELQKTVDWEYSSIYTDIKKDF